MGKQKLSILILSILGLIGTFLNWLNAPLFGTVLSISSEANKEAIWVSLILFIIPLLICLFNKQKALKNIALYSSIIFALLAAGLGIFFILSDWTSPRVDTMLGIPGISQVGLLVGPAPYIVTLSGLLIFFCGLLLKPKIYE